MTREIKKNKRSALEKEHFEILLEDIRDKFKFLAEGHVILNDKIGVLDNKIDNVAHELHTTRNELIFLIKTSIEHSEETLTKKIEDGDNAVIGKLGKQISEVKDLLKTNTDKIDDHEHRISGIEQKLN